MTPPAPYLIVPEIGADLDRATLVEGLPDAENIALVYPKDMPPAFGAPIGGDAAIALVKATEWLLTLTPDRLAEFSAWIIGTYGAKEFAKAFLGAAGKDTWNAVKGLLQRIHKLSETTKSDGAAAAPPLRIKGERLFSGAGNRVFELELDSQWSRDNPRLDQLERHLLLPVLITLKKTELNPSSQRERYILETTQLKIAPRFGTDYQWWLHCFDSLETSVLILIDLSDDSFRWDKGPWKAGIVAKLFFANLEECGFVNKGETPLYELQRTEKIT